MRRAPANVHPKEKEKAYHLAKLARDGPRLEGDIALERVIETDPDRAGLQNPRLN